MNYYSELKLMDDTHTHTHTRKQCHSVVKDGKRRQEERGNPNFFIKKNHAMMRMVSLCCHRN